MTTSNTSRIATWFLIVGTGFLALSHTVDVFVVADSSDERLMFSGFAALNALSAIVLLIPGRRGEPWAWAASWIQVLVTALVMPIAGLDDRVLGYSYLSFAAVMALCLLLARPRSAR